MASTRTPSVEHEQFDAICADLTEWDYLPTVTPHPVELDHEPTEDETNGPIDELILAGLVSPS